MAAGNLFGEDLTPVSTPGAKRRARRGGKARVVRGERHQLRMEARSLDDAIPDDHLVRTLWQATEHLDLSAFYAEILSVEGDAGRPAIDPRILLTLWLYAISEGVGSARKLARLCREHDAYRWIAGGLEICHRVLNQFRTEHGEKLDGLFTRLLAGLMKADVVTLKTVAQDGTRVRASAGADSFRSKKSLRKCLLVADKQVRRLKKRVDDDDDTPTTDGRKKAAKRRAAVKRERAVKEALEALEEVEESRKKNGKKGEARASTTDPEARVMKMADGGFRPAYNFQLAADVGSRIIIDARATNSGGDMGQVDPTLDNILKLGKKPSRYLVDGGYAKKESIERLSGEGISVFTPVPNPPRPRDPSKRQRKDTPAVAEWKARMETDEAKQIYKLRASTIETINGDLKQHRGMRSCVVRGLKRAQAWLTLTCYTHNFLRTLKIAPQILVPSAA